MTYIRGLASAIVVSAIGIWLIYRGITNNTKFMGTALEVPRWIAFLIGFFMQSLLAFYVYLGIKAGFIH